MVPLIELLTQVEVGPREPMAAIEIPASSNILETRTSRWTRALEALNRNGAAVFAALTGFYFLLTLTQAAIRLLWFDEFITFYIAKQNSLYGIWHALSLGTDPNPPLSHIAEMLSMRLFGDSSVAVRLPAILTGWLGLSCLYFFLRRRLPVTYTLAGTLFFMATAAFDYSYESRSYPFMLGFAMLSLLAWRWSVEGNHRYLSATLLAVALAGGISSNYFAVLAFFPIAAGELYRTIEQRRLDLRVWIAMGVGAVPMLFYLPLINSAIARFGPHAWNKPKIDVIADSYTEMIEVILLVSLVIMAVAALKWVLQRRTGKQLLSLNPLPPHESVAVLVNMMYPFLGYAVAVARAGMISPRFLIPMAFGFAIATSVLGYRLFSHYPAATAGFLIVVFAWVLARQGVVASMWLEQRQAFHRVQAHLPYASTIAVPDSLLVLPLYYYSKPDIAKRIVFPIDFEAIRRYKHEDSPEQNLWAGRNGIFPIPIVPLNELNRNTPDFLILAAKNNWLIWDYAVQGHAPQLLPIQAQAEDIGGFTPLAHGEPFYFEKGHDFDSALYASKANRRRAQ